MGVSIDKQAVPARARRSRAHGRRGVSVRVRLEGLDRFESARAVTAAMETVPDSRPWLVVPTAGGNILALSDSATAPAILTAMAEHLTEGGYDGAVIPCRDSFDLLEPQSSKASPIPASAVLAFTIDPPYEDGPFNEHGIVRYRWGVPHDVTVACAREWIDWAVPEHGLATVYPALVDVTREDALDLLVPGLEDVRVTCQLFGAPAGSTTTRIVTARYFGAVILTETGSGKARIPQALEMLTDHVLPQAALVDYATVRITRPNSTRWFGADENVDHWNGYVRHLWSQYVPDPNGIQILTDAHLDKARDLSTRWDVSPAAPGKWLVQAKDLTPWFEPIDEELVPWQQYIDEDVLTQARHDFGHMILSSEDAISRALRGPHAQ